MAIETVFSSWSRARWLGIMKYALIAVVLIALVALSFAKPIDQAGESQMNSAFARAFIGFGIARTLNGVISVAQGTEFAVQPAGIGVNFTPGEILDPINDLVERFSWVMLLATSSVGIQIVLLELCSWQGISLMLAGAAVFWFFTRWQRRSTTRLAAIASRLLLAMLLIRFLIPLGAIANDWIYQQFLQPRFEVSASELEQAGERIREISARTTAAQPTQESGSITQRARNFYNSMTNKFDFTGMLEDYKMAASNISEHAVNLIVVFIVQTVLFPLLFLFLAYRLFRLLLLSNWRAVA